jgi:DNA-binding NarL/FixJ family response regulator
MSTATHSVLIVEDDPETRRHFARAIERCERLRLSAAVATCAEARRVLKETPPDVLLTDLQLPDGNGIELIRETRGELPATQILVISVFGDESTVIASVRAGASGYLLKDGTADQIAASVVELCDGGSPLSAQVARYVLRLVQVPAAGAAAPARTPAPEPAPQRPKDAAPSLTEREVSVLELLAKGFSSTEIAELLGISRHTVITHSRNIHRKLEVSSRSAAIFEAVNLGLIKLGD